MRVCLDCTEEFFQGKTCPTCGSTNIISERAEKEMYMRIGPVKKFKCPRCGFYVERNEEITCCPNCKWNVKVMKQLKDVL